MKINKLLKKKTSRKNWLRVLRARDAEKVTSNNSSIENEFEEERLVALEKKLDSYQSHEEFLADTGDAHWSNE